MPILDKIAWKEEVINAYKSLGGERYLKEVYDYIETHTKREKLPKRWQEIVRKTVQLLSSNYKSLNGKEYLLEFVRRGVYKLRENSEQMVAIDRGSIKDEDFPKRRKVEVNRVIRDTKSTKELKSLYKNKCQICGSGIFTTKGMYSEAHHLQPLGKEHNGPDIKGNIIILCPNHHTEFDYGSIAVNPDTYKILHINKKNEFIGTKININPEHKLLKKYLEYHTKQVFSK
jgi:predicted restriction endonuclease